MKMSVRMNLIRERNKALKLARAPDQKKDRRPFPRRVGRLWETAPGVYRDYSRHIEAEWSKYRAMGLKSNDEIIDHLQKERDLESDTNHELRSSEHG